MNDLVKKEAQGHLIEQDTTTNGINVPRLLELAIDKGASVESLERLMDLQDRWEAKQAKKAFIDALVTFQSEQPVIYKKIAGHNCKYANLADIQLAIGGLLRRVGLSYRFEQSHSESLIGVTCVVTHSEGHSERTYMEAIPDDSGKKNAIQAVGSTVTYLQRYTLIGALGILTADQDLDGRLDVGGGYINEDQAIEIADLIKETKSSEEQFLKFFKADAVKHILDSQYERAIRMLKGKIK